MLRKKIAFGRIKAAVFFHIITSESDRTCYNGVSLKLTWIRQSSAVDSLGQLLQLVLHGAFFCKADRQMVTPGITELWAHFLFTKFLRSPMAGHQEEYWAWDSVCKHMTPVLAEFTDGEETSILQINHTLSWELTAEIASTKANTWAIRTQEAGQSVTS